MIERAGEGVGEGWENARAVPLGRSQAVPFATGNAASPCIDSSFKLRISARARARTHARFSALHARYVPQVYRDILIDLQQRHMNCDQVQELMENLCDGKQQLVRFHRRWFCFARVVSFVRMDFSARSNQMGDLEMHRTFGNVVG